MGCDRKSHGCRTAHLVRILRLFDIGNPIPFYRHRYSPQNTKAHCAMLALEQSVAMTAAVNIIPFMIFIQQKPTTLAPRAHN
jgi:hypothetical protein